MKSVLIAIDFLRESHYTYGLLQSLLRAFPEADVYTLKNFSLGRPQFISNRFFESGISGTSRDFWNSIEKFAKETEKFPWDTYDIVISLSRGPLRWIGKTPQKRPLHIAFASDTYLHVWETRHERKIGTFWDKFDDKDREMYKHLDRQFNQEVNLFIAPGKNIAEKIKEVYNAPATVAYPPADLNTFQPYPQTKGEYFLTTTNEYLDDGILYVIQTFNYIQEKLAIIGAGKREELLRSKSRSNITFYDAGKEEDYAYYLSAARAYIAPDNHKYNPMVLRSLQMGIPVLGLQGSTASDYVRDGKNGFIYHEPSENGLMPLVFKCTEGRFDAELVSQSVQNINENEFVRKIQHLVAQASANFYNTNKESE